jgi:hypothetical protein
MGDGREGVRENNRWGTEMTKVWDILKNPSEYSLWN